jgi:DNA polymerase-1
MPAPLLAVDAPSLLYRAFHALPKTITGPDGNSVNALLGTSNLVLQAVERYAPRAVAFCFGAEAAHYRVELYPTYHADRVDMPEELVPQWEDAKAFFEAFGWTVLRHETLEADDLLGALALAEVAAGGEALLFTGDRDMFQCVNESVTVLWPAGKGETEPIGPHEVMKRYGVRPDQVPDFIAMRGDPSDGLPGARGIGEKGGRDLLREHDTLDALLELPRGLTPRVYASLRDQADELRAFRSIATLQPVDVELPPDGPLDTESASAAARARGMNRLSERLSAWPGA